MNNSSDIMNTTSRPTRDRYDISEEYKRLLYANYAISLLYVLFGIFSAWLAVAILTSTDMRTRLRNQLLSTLFICMMFKCTVCGSIEVAVSLTVWESRQQVSCHLYSFVMYFRLVVEFYDSCLIIILLLVYLTRIMDYDPTKTLTPRMVTLGKIAMLVVPAAVSIIMIPTIGSLYKSVKVQGVCLYVTVDNYLLFKCLDNIVPLVIIAIQLAIISVLYYRRFHHGHSSSKVMTRELIGRGPQIDNVFAYILAGGIDLACRFPSSISVIMMFMDVRQREIFKWISWWMIDARTVFMPLAFMIFDDVRERVKTWRPWYRPAPGIDLRVTYSRSIAAAND